MTEFAPIPPPDPLWERFKQQLYADLERETLRSLRIPAHLLQPPGDRPMPTSIRGCTTVTVHRLKRLAFSLPGLDEPIRAEDLTQAMIDKEITAHQRWQLEALVDAIEIENDVEMGLELPLCEADLERANQVCPRWSVLIETPLEGVHAFTDEDNLAAWLQWQAAKFPSVEVFNRLDRETAYTLKEPDDDRAWSTRGDFAVWCELRQIDPKLNDLVLNTYEVDLQPYRESIGRIEKGR